MIKNAKATVTAVRTAKGKGNDSLALRLQTRFDLDIGEPVHVWACEQVRWIRDVADVDSGQSLDLIFPSSMLVGGDVKFEAYELPPGDRGNAKPVVKGEAALARKAKVFFREDAIRLQVEWRIAASTLPKLTTAQLSKLQGSDVWIDAAEIQPELGVK